MVFGKKIIDKMLDKVEEKGKAKIKKLEIGIEENTKEMNSMVNKTSDKYKKAAKLQAKMAKYKRNILILKAALPVIGNFLYYFYLLLLIVVILAVFVIYLTSMFTFSKTDTATSLTYFEADTFYGLPYKSNFDKGGSYRSIFDMVKPLEMPSTEIKNNTIKLNNLIKERMKKTKIKDVVTDCGAYCEKTLDEMYSFKLTVSNQWFDKNDAKEYILLNARTGNPAKSISLSFMTRIDDKVYNNYYYSTIRDNIKDSSFSYSDVKDATHTNEVNYLLIAIKNKINTYNDKTYSKTGEKIVNEKEYLKYFLSKDSLIENIYKKKGFTDDNKKVKIMIDSYYNFMKKNPDLRNKLRARISDIIEFNETKLKSGAIIDMLNFAGVAEKGMTMSNSKSNQFILSNEKINLDYFNNIPFGKDYKEIIINTKEFKDFSKKDAQRILRFRGEDSVDADSNEFGFYVPEDYIIIPSGFYTKDERGYNKRKIIKKENRKAIGKVGKHYYSPDVTYKDITNGKSEYKTDKTTCKVFSPPKEKGDYVIYNKETIYTGEVVTVKCVTKHKKHTTVNYYNYKAPPLIEEAEVIFYKKFKFKDKKKNKESIREKKDYYLNYFYQKEYIDLDENGIAKGVDKVSDIYLDRQSIQFKGIYIKVRGFGLEAINDGELITKKKVIDGYEALLPDAPVKIQIGLLTDVDYEKLRNAKEFRDKNLAHMKSIIDKTEKEQKRITQMQRRKQGINQNDFFLVYQSPLYKKHTQADQLQDMKIAKGIGDIKDSLSSKIYDYFSGQTAQAIYLKLYADKRADDFKNSYFYTSVQNKKFFDILNDVYGLNKRNKSNNKIDLLKKYLVFLSDGNVDFDKVYSADSKLKKYAPYKGIFNNYYENDNKFYSFKFLTKEEIKENRGEGFWDKLKKAAYESVGSDYEKRDLKKPIQYNTRMFNKCYSYVFLDENFKKIRRDGKGGQLIDIGLMSFARNGALTEGKATAKREKLLEYEKNIIRNDLVIPCYNSYFSYIEVEIEPNINNDVNKAKYGTLEKEILKDFGSKRVKVYINDPKFLKYLKSEDFIITPINGNVANMTEIFTLFENIDLEEEKDFQEALDLIFYNENGPQILWNIYKLQDEYKDSCNPKTERLLKEPYNPNFKCSYSDVFEEFIDKLSQNKNNYFFIKEEYLKEKIRDQPFYHYYNTNLPNTRYEPGTETSDSGIFGFIDITKSKGFFPLKKSRTKNTNSHLQLPETGTEEYYENQYREDNIRNELANDFTYSFNLENTFNYDEKSYSTDLDLHFVPLNPNLYLHSFFKTIKNGEKYTLDVYGNGFRALNQNQIKADIEKNYISDITHFLLTKVTNNKVILELKDLVEKTKNESKEGYTLWIGFYDRFFSLLRDNKVFTDTTVTDNISIYIDNIAIGKKVEEMTGKPFNNSEESNYDLIVNKFDDNNIGLYESILNDKSHIEDNNKKSIIYRYWYSVYVLELLKDYYQKENIKINGKLIDLSLDYEGIINELTKVDNNEDPVARLYKETLLYSWMYVLDEDFNSLFGIGLDLFGTDTAEDFLDLKPTEIYKQTDAYKEHTSLILKKIENLTEAEKIDFREAIEKLENPDFLESIYINRTRQDKYSINLAMLQGINIKKEKVLNLELYYKNLMLIVALKAKEADVPVTRYIDIMTDHYKVLKKIKSGYTSDYNTYYLQPIINNTELTDDQVLKLKELFTKIKDKYGLKTTYADYVVYMDIIKEGLPKEIDQTKNVYISYSKFKKNYEYRPLDEKGNPNTIEKVRKEFLNQNQTSNLPLYGMLSDLFLPNSATQSSVRLITLTNKEKKKFDINILKNKIAEENKKLNDLKENRDGFRLALSEKILSIKAKDDTPEQSEDKIRKIIKKNQDKIINKKIQWIELKIKNYKNRIKELEDEIKSYDEFEEEGNKQIVYQVSVENGSISLKRILTDEEKEDNYEKAILFTGPFSDTKEPGFMFHGELGGPDDTVLIKNTLNTFFAYSFMINNLKVTENGVKKIVDELVLYSLDEFNSKYKNFENIENLGNFGSYYYNFDYVNPNDDKNKIRFVLKGLEYGEGTLPGMQFDSDFSVVSIKDKAAKEILDKKFENLKTTFCPTMGKNSEKCVNYMSYLQTLSPSALDAEMEYITLIYALKKYTNILPGGEVVEYRHYKLADAIERKEGKPTALSKYFDTLQKNNPLRLGQCTRYVGVLKRTDNGNGPAFRAGNGVDVAGYYGRHGGYATDYFNPKTESEDSILKKIQVGDIISFKGRNSKINKKCIHYSNGKNIDHIGHVAIVIGKNNSRKTITLAEANTPGQYNVYKNEYPVKQICSGTVAHGVPRAY